MGIFKESMDEKNPEFKTKVITEQKDLFATKQTEANKEKNLNEINDDLNKTIVSVNNNLIPEGNLPSDKHDAVDLLQSHSAIHAQPRELHVALDNSYQIIEKKDGHYMTQLKRLINGNENIRADGIDGGDEEESDYRLYYNETEYNAESIRAMTNEGVLNAVVSKMDEIISTCRKYRLTHLWPWTRRGKERKADVVRAQREAEARRQAAKTRIKELSKSKKVASGGKKTVVEKATGGFRRVVNYTKTFLWGMTVRNAVNTAAMAVALPFWAVGSIAKTAASLFTSGVKFGLKGAFTLPHPHLPSTWYTHYATKSISDISEKEIRNKKKERDKCVPGSKKYLDLDFEIQYLENSLYARGYARWHSFFSGSTIFDNFGYSPFNANWDQVDYNNMQQI